MIRTLRRVALSAALLALVAIPAQAQSANVTGKWAFTSEGGRGPMTTTFTFTQNGNTVTGSGVFAFGRRGGSGEARPPIEIKNGTIKGDSLTFSVEMSFGGGGQGLTLNYAAQVSGDTMKGTQTTPRGERPFTAKRVKE
jgi:hypothetical protein